VEQVLRVSHFTYAKEQLDTKPAAFAEQEEDVFVHECVLLQMLGFDLFVEHPHAHVVKWGFVFKVGKEMTQMMSYRLATNSLLVCVCSITQQWSPASV
jgi:hypothetical protein